MAKNLLIVESPNKISKIESFLGKDWKVMASIGHIRDLATWGTRLRLGLDLDEMEPVYIDLKDKKDIISDIKKESKKATNIYLAMDPDREGEAIAFHVKSILENKNANIKRITFNEITKESVNNSINNPRDIDEDLVQSQEARRILDRMIGFRLSFLTNKKISAKSAGRVKSSVLKMIIDRENEIEKFVPEYWWTIEGEISKDESLVNVDGEKFSEIQYKNESDAINTHKSLTGNFEYVQSKESKRIVKAPLPFEMATFLMAMYSAHGTPNNSATFALQSLYEKGLITYPRTDSKRISSKDFIDSITTYIENSFGKEFYESVPKVKGKKNDQDAHEAIRPVDINKTPSNIKDLKINEKRAYTLIWMTTMKSFMIPGQNTIVKNVYKDGENYFTYKKSYPTTLGFRVVDGLEKIDRIEPEHNLKIDIKKIEIIDHETKPPGRYNPSSLIKLMKDAGIGRPSTYSGVISGLVGYNYLINNSGSLKPTPIAQEVNDLLQGNFKDIVNEDYTAGMENKLDEISQGKVNSRKYLKEFWNEFEPRIEKANETIPKKPPVYTGKKCPECEIGNLIVKRGRFGEFIACDRYPECKYSEPLEPKAKPVETGEKCPVCGKPLVIREAKRTKSKFIACSGFPKCDYIQPEEKTVEVLLDLGEITKEQKIKRLEKHEKRLAKEQAKKEAEKLTEKGE